MMAIIGQRYYNKWNLRTMPRVHSELYTPFEANFGFSPKEPPDLLFSMRPSIPVSQDATERLRLLQDVHAMVRSVLQLHNDEMQART
jgi:hypothetical protein